VKSVNYYHRAADCGSVTLTKARVTCIAFDNGSDFEPPEA